MKVARQPATDSSSHQLPVDRSTFDQLMVPVYAPSQVLPVRGQGLRLYDQGGECYLDFTSGIGVTSLGHGHEAVVKALVDQAHALWHISNGFTNEPVLRLASALTEATFAEQAFFCNSGAEANEAALKLARKQAGTDKRRIISCQQSFHGRTFFTVSVGGQPKYQDGFGPLPAKIDHIPFNDPVAAADAIRDDVCAVIVEPVLGEGGIVPASAQFLRVLRERCNATGALLIFDEVQCGLGRIGSLYAYQQYGITPDILTTAKALGNGFPIGAMLTTKNIAKHFSVATHGTTFGGNPLAAAVALAVVTAINDAAFLARVQVAHQRLWSGLEKLVARFPQAFDHIRGKGLMLGVALSRAAKGKAKEFQKLTEKHKLLVLSAGLDVVRLLPALVVSDAEIDEALEKLTRAAEAFVVTLPR
ncbi:MAG: acetylornithine/succinyldiaminopimelate transaminase [Gammaproteobacteria bacterium]|nr:acetylornithine/succinyldiaminopimelate transaminase [Gammaproteobacteria bacterium]